MSAKMKNTILIVDDEPDILNLTEKFLKLGDFDTITCSNAKEALKVIEERYNDIAMVLLDTMMPGLNTEKFLQSVKSDERYKHILVKFFSIKGFHEDILKDKKLGANGYITKPFSGKELRKRLQEQKAKESIERIKSLMREKSVNKLTIERKYLPEIFRPDIIDISKDGGIPILKPFVIEYFRSKGIITEFYGNVIEFKKQQELNCKFCGNRLVKEQKICPVCGKMVI